MVGLREVLTQVRERIERYRTSPPINEQNTKAALIDPVLRALGWDVEDIEEVHREFEMTLRLPRLRTFCRHKRNETLAVRRDIEVRSGTGVR